LTPWSEVSRPNSAKPFISPPDVIGHRMELLLVILRARCLCACAPLSRPPYTQRLPNGVRAIGFPKCIRPYILVGRCGRLLIVATGSVARHGSAASREWRTHDGTKVWCFGIALDETFVVRGRRGRTDTAGHGARPQSLLRLAEMQHCDLPGSAAVVGEQRCPTETRPKDQRYIHAFLINTHANHKVRTAGC